MAVMRLQPAPACFAACPSDWYALMGGLSTALTSLSSNLRPDSGEWHRDLVLLLGRFATQLALDGPLACEAVGISLVPACLCDCPDGPQ